MIFADRRRSGSALRGRRSGLRGSTDRRHRLARRDPSDRRPDLRCRAAGALRASSATRCRCPTWRRCPGPRTTPSAASTGSPIITVHGRAPNHVRGNLNLTTVGVSRGGLSLVAGRPRLVRQRDQPSSPRRRSTRRTRRRAADPRGQPAGVPDLRAGRRVRGAGPPRLPGEGRRPGGRRRAPPSQGAAGRGRRDRRRSTGTPRRTPTTPRPTC